MKYHCDDCDATMTAPTDTDTIRCPGCGEMADKATAPADELRERVRRAICEASGIDWDPDMLEPDEYGEHADAVLAVLPDWLAAADAAVGGPAVAEDTIGLCGYCGVPREGHHHGYVSTAAVLAVARQILGTAVTVSCSDVRLDNGENLRDLAVGDHLELSEPAAGMRPGTWQVVDFHGRFRDRATMRLVPAVTEEPGR
ncbi:hypothetical protein [Streptomyces sp. sk2.1]|uniref:hypothetical protein n=1 Tax=Streptomyces sp. sk2.1 TaxID=2478959 RepID=UPI0011E7BDA3|nr:hypothetical protein [Streptomyces sp. sk2.1]TXS78662.1 hypothetical protein EAO76_09890 [Streptomyces sp. sk2.1]